MTGDDANSSGQILGEIRLTPTPPDGPRNGGWNGGWNTGRDGYQEPPKTRSVVASIAAQSASRSVCSTSAIARTVCGTR